MHEQRKAEEIENVWAKTPGDADAARCSHCGGTSFEWGYIDSPISGSKVRFQSYSGSFFGLRLRHGPQVRGRCCRTCSHLELFLQAPAKGQS